MASYRIRHLLLFTARCTVHYSAKRGIAIACHPSVCLSENLVDQDHIGWKSRRLIARTICATRSSSILSGVGKIGVLENKSDNISETRKGREKVTMEGLYKLINALLNDTVPTHRPMASYFLRLGVHNFATPTQNFNRCYLRNG